MADRGRNNGVTGLVDITGSPKFWASIRSFSFGVSNQKRGRGGRGQGRFQKSRPMTPGGQLVVSGVMRQDVPPVPANFQGETGTITLQFNTGATQAVAVRVDSASISYSSTKSDEWAVAFTCEILADPVYTGFGASAPSASAQPATTTVELYDGTQKTYDPDGLLTGATRVYDVWGSLDDTDAAEVGLIMAALANTAPIDGLKGRVSSVHRTDSHGCAVTVSYAMTTTGEDQINSHTALSTDADFITNHATTAAWIGDPPTPTGTGWVHATTNSIVFNESKTLTVWTWALRTPKQGIEQDRSRFQHDDTYGIEVERVITLVTDSETPPSAPSGPSGTVAHGPASDQLNNLRWAHSFRFTPYIAKELIEVRGTSARTDASGLEDEERVTLVATTIPSTPTPTISGLVLVDTVGPDKTNSRTYFAWTFIFGRRTRKTAIEQDGSHKQTDPGNVRFGEVLREITDTDVEPTWAPSVANVEKRSVTKKAHGSKFIWTAEFGDSGTLNELKNRASRIHRDTAGIDDEDLIATTSATDAQPADPTLRSGLKVVGCVTEKVNSTPLYLHIFKTARADSIDKIIAAGTHTETDVSGLESKATTTTVETTDTPSNTTPPSGLQYIGTDVKPIPGTTKYVQRHEHRLNTPEQERNFKGSRASYRTYDHSVTRTAEVLTDATDIDVIGSIDFLARKADANYFGVDVERETPMKVIKTTIMGQEEHTISSRFHWFEGFMPSVLDGGTVKVRVSRAWYVADLTATLVEVVPEYVGMILADIEVTSIRTHATEYSYDLYPTRMGKTNPSTFLGMSAGLMKYVGALPDANLRITVPRKDRTSWRFQYCSLGHWTHLGITMGEHWVSGDLSASEGTLVAASTIFPSATAAVVPASSDSFIVFLP